MNFLKTSIFSGLSTIIKIMSGLVINKIIAVYAGPSGIALIGQFQNFLSIITTVGNGATNSGVTKYVAEFHEKDPKKRNDFISASLIISFIISITLGLIIFIGSSFLSEMIFKNKEFSSILKLLGVNLTLISLNSILLSIINGLKKIKLFIIINITSSLLSLIITSLLTIIYGVFGALLSMIVVQSLILFISLPIVKRKINIDFKLNVRIEKEVYQKLFAFSSMAIVSIISVAITQILIRNHLINNFSIEQAGYWQSVWMISTMYLMVLTVALSTYYLPKLSELHKPEEIKREILSGYKIILPFVIVTAMSIFLLRDFIITVLFTTEFYEMRSLFAFQLIGDFFKMASWTLSFLMIAKAMTRTFIITEIIFAISFYVLTIILTKQNGLVGVTHAYALNYCIYFITMLIIFRKVLNINIRKYFK